MYYHSLLVFGTAYMMNYGKYSHKRTGRLVHCYGSTDDFTDHYVDEIYSYHAYGDASLDDTHNCTIIGNHWFNHLTSARNAATRVPLGTIETVYIADVDGSMCVDSITRHNNFVIGVSLLLSSLGCCLIPFFVYACLRNRIAFEESTTSTPTNGTDNGDIEAVGRGSSHGSNVEGAYTAVKAVCIDAEGVLDIVDDVDFDDCF